MSDITPTQFANRFTTLVLKGNGLPRKPLDRRILLVSALIDLEAGQPYTEPQLNEILKRWSEKFGDNVCLDHVSLRRFLVDEHFLIRDDAGKSYVAKKEGLPFSVDPAIWSLNLQELVAEAEKERENRKQTKQKESER